MDLLVAAGQLPEGHALVLSELSQPGNLLRVLKPHMFGFIVKDTPAATLADGNRREPTGTDGWLEARRRP